MNFNTKYFSLFLLVFILSCRKSQIGTTTTTVSSILIIGNSIVSHPSDPAIGWFGDWGMAASVADSDFVHILTKSIHAQNENITVTAINLADFERGYTTYSLKNLDSLKNPDIVIIKLAENVDDNSVFSNNFIFHYNNLVKYIAPTKKTVTIITDGFWANQNVNILLKQYANDNNLPFVKLNDLSSDTTNTAAGEFQDPGVAKHPSDKGMRLIAGRIWESLQKYL